jgi:Patatin-like phospholipase
LHDALKSALGDEFLFGGEHESDGSYATKVAVTSTSETGQQAMILSNYSRQEDEQFSYKFEVSDGPSLGVRIWEAACATSAAPSYFKPFKSSRTGRSYLDGALYYNNPARVAYRESRLLWPDVAENHPDIFLSIGTGQNLQKTKMELGRDAAGAKGGPKRNPTLKYGKPDLKNRGKIFRAWNTVERFFSVLVSLSSTVSIQLQVSNEVSRLIEWITSLIQRLPGKSSTRVWPTQ